MDPRCALAPAVGKAPGCSVPWGVAGLSDEVRQGNDLAGQERDVQEVPKAGQGVVPDGRSGRVSRSAGTSAA